MKVRDNYSTYLKDFIHSETDAVALICSDKTKEENVSGSLRMYEFPEVTSAPKLQMEFSDLGKIVDAAYRFRNDGK